VSCKITLLTADNITMKRKRATNSSNSLLRSRPQVHHTVNDRQNAVRANTYQRLNQNIASPLCRLEKDTSCATPPFRTGHSAIRVPDAIEDFCRSLICSLPRINEVSALQVKVVSRKRLSIEFYFGILGFVSAEIEN